MTGQYLVLHCWSRCASTEMIRQPDGCAFGNSKQVAQTGQKSEVLQNKSEVCNCFTVPRQEVGRLSLTWPLQMGWKSLAWSLPQGTRD